MPTLDLPPRLLRELHRNRPRDSFRRDADREAERHPLDRDPDHFADRCVVCGFLFCRCGRSWRNAQRQAWRVLAEWR